MGWFRQVLDIFNSGNEESSEMEEENVDLLAIPSWIESRLDSEFDKIRPEIDAQFSILFDEKKNLLMNLEDLKAAALQNPNISEREKQIMEGNRASYISQHKQFLNVVEISEKPNCQETTKFCKNFEELLVRLATSTAKGHLVMKEFFADRASKINRSIKTMGGAVSKMREILVDGNVGVDDVEDIGKGINDLKAKKKLSSEIDEELLTLGKKLSNSRFLMNKLNKNIDELKQTENYAGFRSLSDSRESHWASFKQAEEQVNNEFSPLQKAMKRFERMIAEDQKLFMKYIDSPMQALIEDENLKIFMMLDKMKTAISSGSLEVKDPEKMMQKISELDKQKLVDARSRYSEAKTSIKTIDDQMRNSKVMEELNDLQYKIEHTERQVKIIEDKIAQANKTKEKIDLDALRSNLEQELKEVFGLNVHITWQDNTHTA